MSDHTNICINASNWPSIKVERMRKLSLEVFKSIHGLVTINRAKYDIIDHFINTRGNKSTIRLPRIRTEAARKTAYTTCYLLMQGMKYPLPFLKDLLEIKFFSFYTLMVYLLNCVFLLLGLTLLCHFQSSSPL